MHPNSRVAKKMTDVRSSLEDDPELVMSPRCGSDPQGSEKWIAQIAALFDKMPSVGQISV